MLKLVSVLQLARHVKQSKGIFVECIVVLVLADVLCRSDATTTHSLIYMRVDYNSCTVFPHLQLYSKLLRDSPIECVVKCNRRPDCHHAVYCPESKLCYYQAFTRGSEVCGQNCTVCPCFKSKDTEVEKIIPAGNCEVSSTHPGGDYGCDKATDGIAFDPSWDYGWASHGEDVGAWIKIFFQKPIRLLYIRIMQRPKDMERSKDLELLFSDGSKQMVTLAEYPEGFFWDEFRLTSVTTYWVKITVLSIYDSLNNGFQEIEFYGFD